jgi:uncharacterized membrane protein (UPF0127 family)
MSYIKRYKTSRLKNNFSCERLNWHGLLLASAAALLLVLLAPGPLSADPLLTYPLRLGDHSIRAELANTPETRRKGLMFRKRLAESSGMVFVFPRQQRISMWMKNTSIALSVAFIDVDGRILNIEDMQPQSEQSHSSAGPAKYALEMNQGWFRKRGIGPDDQVFGLERLPKSK